MAEYRQSGVGIDSSQDGARPIAVLRAGHGDDVRTGKPRRPAQGVKVGGKFVSTDQHLVARLQADVFQGRLNAIRSRADDGDVVRLRTYQPRK